LVSRAVGECGRLRSCRGSVPALTPHNGRGDEPTNFVSARGAQPWLGHYPQRSERRPAAADLRAD
jgi:hypothetical protein